MIHWLQQAWSSYGAHPLHANGYQWWSGAGSDLGEITLLAAIVAVLKHKNCHEKGCWRLGHSHPEHGFPVCRKHYRRELKV